MTGLVHLPGSRPRAIFLEIGEHDPRFIVPLVVGEMEGLQARRVRPGGDLERPTLPISWIVIIDDRGPGAAGPSSFDAGTLRWLFADAFQIAIDAAEPKMELYEYLGNVFSLSRLLRTVAQFGGSSRGRTANFTASWNSCLS